MEMEERRSRCPYNDILCGEDCCSECAVYLHYISYELIDLENITHSPEPAVHHLRNILGCKSK